MFCALFICLISVDVPTLNGGEGEGVKKEREKGEASWDIQKSTERRIIKKKGGRMKTVVVDAGTPSD